ncbi:unnamed protein product, partial [Polarella glacialis]
MGNVACWGGRGKDFTKPLGGALCGLKGCLKGNGRTGDIVGFDRSDEVHTYKLLFLDGLEPSVDWFAEADVELRSAPFKITVLPQGLPSFELSSLRANQSLLSVQEKIEEHFAIGPGRAQIMPDKSTSSFMFTSADGPRCVGVLGFGEGSVITCVAHDYDKTALQLKSASEKSLSETGEAETWTISALVYGPKGKELLLWAEESVARNGQPPSLPTLTEGSFELACRNGLLSVSLLVAEAQNKGTKESLAKQLAARFNRAFAAIKTGGSAVTWGNAEYGGDASAVAPLLAGGVVQICGNTSAFAAIKANGSVVTWGFAGNGGDSSAVAPLLAEGVVQVCGSRCAFVAIKANGSVVTWGSADVGGDSSAVAPLLAEGVVQVCGTNFSFAAIKANGSVVTWGSAGKGGDSSAVAPLLAEGVVQICVTGCAFAAIKANGSVVTWGITEHGGDSSAVAPLLAEGVVQVCGNQFAFAAIKANGSVVTWGFAGNGGDSSAVAPLLAEGIVLYKSAESDSSAVAALLAYDVVQVCGNQFAFAAIKANGSVVTWGGADVGGDSSAVAPLLAEGVVQVCGNTSAFAAIKANGSVVTWGGPGKGGDSSAVAALLTDGVVQVFGNQCAFATIKANGSVVTWGSADLVAIPQRLLHFCRPARQLFAAIALSLQVLPLPSNAEQKAIVEAVFANPAVLVVGPPGTGKTHCIANVCCAAMCQGLHVLVVSERDQALDVLRAKLPSSIRSWVVHLRAGGGSSSGSAWESQQELQHLLERLSELPGMEASGALRHLESQERVRQQCNQRLAALDTELASLMRSDPGQDKELQALWEQLLAANSRLAALDPGGAATRVNAAQLAK